MDGMDKKVLPPKTTAQLVTDPKWRQMMLESDSFFLSGGVGKSLRELGYE